MRRTADRGGGSITQSPNFDVITPRYVSEYAKSLSRQGCWKYWKRSGIYEMSKEKWQKEGGEEERLRSDEGTPRSSIGLCAG